MSAIADNLAQLLRELTEAERLATEVHTELFTQSAGGGRKTDRFYNLALRMESIQMRISGIREEVESLQ